MSTADQRPDATEAEARTPDLESQSAEAPTENDAEHRAEQPAGLTSTGRVRRTRMSSWWVGLIIAAVLLIALLIFIGQNSRTVTVHYLGLEGRASLAVMLLLAAVAGVLLVAIPGTARIMQLRRALKKNNTHRKS